MTREEIVKECDEMSQLNVADPDFYASISRELKKAEKLEKVVEIIKKYKNEFSKDSNDVVIMKNGCIAITYAERELFKEMLTNE